MAIEPYVKALNENSYNAQELTHLDRFLESYNGRTLFEHIAHSRNPIVAFNDTFSRFAVLLKTTPPMHDEKAIFGLVLMQGFAIMVNKLVTDSSEATLLDMINDPMKYFSFLQPDIQTEMIPLLDMFNPVVDIPKMIRNARLLHDISKLTTGYASLSQMTQAGLKDTINTLAQSPLYAAHRNNSYHYSAARWSAEKLKTLTSTFVSNYAAEFIPSVETASSLRLIAFASAISHINIDNLFYPAAQQKEEHLFLLHTIYQSANETVKKEIVGLIETFVIKHKKDIPTLNIITKTLMPAPLGSWDPLPHSDTPALLSQLSASSIKILMDDTSTLIADPEARINYFIKQLSVMDGKDFTLAREANTSDGQWRADCLLATFIALGAVPQVKALVIKMSTSDDYADKNIKALISSPKTTLVPTDARSGFLNHLSGLAYLNAYAINRPLYKLDVTSSPPMHVSTLIRSLLDVGIRQIQIASRIKQCTSTLFTNVQEIFVEKQLNDATLHYFLTMPSLSEMPFELIIKARGLLPGPLTLASEVNKKACADYLVDAIPHLLPNNDDEYHFDKKNGNPFHLYLNTEPDPSLRITRLQNALMKPEAPNVVWILFGIGSYSFDIYLFAKCIKPGYFTVNGCGDLALLKEEIPSVVDMHAITTHVVLTSPNTSTKSITTKDTKTPETQYQKINIIPSSQKTVENKF